MTTGTSDTARLRAALAGELAAEGFLRSPVWREAFERVPRHVFAARYWVSEADGTWSQRDVADPDQDLQAHAMAMVYSNDTLVTRIDADGTAISSSTEPSLMALMLERLDARPGHRVLEIGTGTGYNAALLCHVMGSDAVTTIDLDPTLVSDAWAALSAAGYRPTVVCGDGALGVASGAPYDRIIATCGVDRVPGPWAAQLADDGALLLNLSKGIVLLRRVAGGGLGGRFLGPAGFMPLRSNDSAAALTGRQLMDATGGTPDEIGHDLVPAGLDFAMATFFTCLVADRSDLAFVHNPNGTVRSYRWLHPASGSWSRVELSKDTAAAPAKVGQSGPRRLWTELTPILGSWNAAGRPAIDRYGITVTPTGEHRLWLEQPARHVGTLTAAS